MPNGPRIVVTADHTDDSWMADAACRGHQDIFWPAVPHHSTYLQATRICATCPVIDECADYADRHQLEGVWGGSNRWGTSKRDRARTAADVDIEARRIRGLSGS